MMQAVFVWVRAQTGFASLPPSGIGEMRWYRELPAGGDYFLSLKVTSKTDAACVRAVGCTTPPASRTSPPPASTS